MSTEAQGLLAQTYQQSRRELRSYLTRIVLRPDVAEELVQQAAVKLVEAGQGDKDMPDNADGMRAWLFRVGTHLAIDHLRRHSTWRENIMLEAREVAEGSEAFLSESALLRGSAETSAIAREHLRRAARLEHHGFACLAEQIDFAVGGNRCQLLPTAPRICELRPAIATRPTK